MYQDYNNMFNPSYTGGEFNSRAYIPSPEKSDEIITLQEAVELIKKSINNEKEDELFYEEIIKQALTEKEKNIIRSIRDDERKHSRILKNLYLKFTGQMINENPITTNNVATKNSYSENLEKALFSELEAVIKYRRIMGAMPDNDSYTLVMSIMTDELRHASKYNFLIHNAKR